ncbi:hypothetical protein QL285_015932 [Trifolium repens]|nr:hypothetical protein QL285_015932 [Trifolium repens]
MQGHNHQCEDKYDGLNIDGCWNSVLEVMISNKCHQKKKYIKYNCSDVNRYKSEDLYVTVGQGHVVLDHASSGLKTMLNWA